MNRALNEKLDGIKALCEERIKALPVKTQIQAHYQHKVGGKLDFVVTVPKKELDRAKAKGHEFDFSRASVIHNFTNGFEVSVPSK